MNAAALDTRLADLEKKIKTVDKLKAQVKTLEAEVKNLKDIEAINRLQRAYGYYVEHMMGKEIIDCFTTSDDVYLKWLEGRYNGQASLHRYFDKCGTPSLMSSCTRSFRYRASSPWTRTG